MGYTEDQFWRTTPRFFACAMDGYVEGDQEKWERARYVAYFSFLGHAKKDSLKKITDLGKFSWEDFEGEQLTPEKAAQLDSAWLAFQEECRKMAENNQN